MRRLLSLSSFLISGLAPTAFASAAPPLQPFKPWVLDYADAQCVAFRQYGNANDPISLAVRPAPNGETYELLVTRQRVGPKLAEEAEGDVDFGTGRTKAWLLTYGVKSKETRENVSLHQYRISATEMAKARFAKQVTFHIRGDEDGSFTLDSLPALLDGLAACNTDLQQYWNMDGEKDGRIAVPSKGDLRGIFSPDDYPAEAMDRSQEGSSQFLLLINEQGRVAGCHVEKASGVPIFDVMGCQVIRSRAKFSPALDGKGNPVRSTVITPPVSWRMEG